MPCYHPVTGYKAIRLNENGKRSIVFNPAEGFRDKPLQLPCGRCIGCRLERSRQWAIRCVHEAQMHEENCSITLTYSPEKLPPDGSLNKSHIQLFMKKLRKSLYPKKIRYFYCGEYGEKLGRPHYHLLLFGHEFPDKKKYSKTDRGDTLYTSEKLDTLWSHGECKIGELTFESAAYAARYITKKISGPEADTHYNVIDLETGEVYSSKIPEFIDMSRRPGIGKPFYEKFKTDIFPSDEVILRGIKMKPPKFYMTTLEKQCTDEYARVKAGRQNAGKRFVDENTHERLSVKKESKLRKLNQLKRTFEND